MLIFTFLKAHPCIFVLFANSFAFSSLFCSLTALSRVLYNILIYKNYRHRGRPFLRSGLLWCAKKKGAFPYDPTGI